MGGLSFNFKFLNQLGGYLLFPLHKYEAKAENKTSMHLDSLCLPILSQANLKVLA